MLSRQWRVFIHAERATLKVIRDATVQQAAEVGRARHVRLYDERRRQAEERAAMAMEDAETAAWESLERAEAARSYSLRDIAMAPFEPHFSDKDVSAEADVPYLLLQSFVQKRRHQLSRTHAFGVSSVASLLPGAVAASALNAAAKSHRGGPVAQVPKSRHSPIPVLSHVTLSDRYRATIGLPTRTGFGSGVPDVTRSRGHAPPPTSSSVFLLQQQVESSAPGAGALVRRSSVSSLSALVPPKDSGENRASTSASNTPSLIVRLDSAAEKELIWREPDHDALGKRVQFEKPAEAVPAPRSILLRKRRGSASLPRPVVSAAAPRAMRTADWSRSEPALFNGTNRLKLVQLTPSANSASGSSAAAMTTAPAPPAVEESSARSRGSTLNEQPTTARKYFWPGLQNSPLLSDLDVHDASSELLFHSPAAVPSSALHTPRRHIHRLSGPALSKMNEPLSRMSGSRVAQKLHTAVMLGTGSSAPVVALSPSSDNAVVQKGSVAAAHPIAQTKSRSQESALTTDHSRVLPHIDAALLAFQDAGHHPVAHAGMEKIHWRYSLSNPESVISQIDTHAVATSLAADATHVMNPDLTHHHVLQPEDTPDLLARKAGDLEIRMADHIGECETHDTSSRRGSEHRANTRRYDVESPTLNRMDSVASGLASPALHGWTTNNLIQLSGQTRTSYGAARVRSAGTGNGSRPASATTVDSLSSFIAPLADLAASP
jgi:hypothetical protein